MDTQHTPTIADRLGIAAVILLLAAFTLSAMSVLVPRASADELSGKRDDDAVEVEVKEDDDDDDTGNTGNTGGGTRDTGTGTTKGTGQSNNSNTRDSGTKTGTTRGTGPSNTNTNDTKTGTRTKQSNTRQSNTGGTR